MKEFECCEICWQEKTSDNWGLVAPTVTFTKGEKTHTVKGFVADVDTCKARFIPEEAGTWDYRVEGTDISGQLEIEPSDGKGVVKAVDCHFEYQRGGYFYPFGTTIYALIHQSAELYEETMKTLSGAPFNKIRFCVFPKHYDYNHNEPRHYAFEKTGENWDVTKPCFAYWNMLEDAIVRLGELGIQCDLILFHPYDRWGFSKFSEKEDLIYLDYLLRRLSAFPNVWWSLSNEYDLVEDKTLEHWEHIEEFIAKNDPYHHLMGNHNCFKFWDHTRENITHASLQTKMMYRIPEWRKLYKKPVCIDECCYEGNIIHGWGSISGKEMTFRFWRAVVGGGYCTHGETFYSDDEVLWWARGGKLKGESPARIRFLREITEKLPGPIEPMVGLMEQVIVAQTEEEKKSLIDNSDWGKGFLTAAGRLGVVEGRMFAEFEHGYDGHVGEEAYIKFYDIHTNVLGDIILPENRKYKLEVIDVWDMTREVISESASGRVEFKLPGKEGMAVLATALK